MWRAHPSSKVCVLFRSSNRFQRCANSSQSDSSIFHATALSVASLKHLSLTLKPGPDNQDTILKVTNVPSTGLWFIGHDFAFISCSSLCWSANDTSLVYRCFSLRPSVRSFALQLFRFYALSGISLKTANRTTSVGKKKHNGQFRMPALLFALLLP